MKGKNENNLSQKEAIIAGVFGVVVFVGVVLFSMGADSGIPQIAKFSQFMSQLISFSTSRQCSDGIDNDHDGAVDYPADFSCSSPKDDNEQLPWSECFDGLDNDDDGLADFINDSDCTSIQDNTESNIPNPQCSDGIDNDGDDRVDYPADIGCVTPSDDNERDPDVIPPPPKTVQCSDGIDNDKDGLMDYPGDSGCSSIRDNDEYNVPVTPPPPPPVTTMTPGSGFTGATPVPGPRGSSTQQGYDATAIAHWDTVPYQTINGHLNVAVLAYHFNDIDYVDFSADGGPWIRVSTETLNPETNAKEFWTRFDANNFPDGRVEIRAIAYPKIGQPKVLQGGAVSDQSSSLFLNANAHGSMQHVVRYASHTGNDSNPCTSEAQACATMLRAINSAAVGNSLDGAEIRLGAGDWDITPIPGGLTGGAPWVPSYNTDKQWFTLTSAPSTDKDHVVITGMSGPGDSAGLWLKYVRLTNVSVVGRIDKTPGVGVQKYLWIDNSKVFNRDTVAFETNAASCAPPIQGYAGWTGVWLTDLYMDKVCDGPRDATLARNIYVERTLGGHSSGTATVVNYSVKYIYGSGYHFPDGQVSPDVHGDVYQFQGRRSDAILYALKTVPGGLISSRGLAGYMNGDIAIINNDITVPIWVFSACSPINHLVVKNSIFRGYSTPWCAESHGTLDPNQIRNVLFDHVVFDNGTPQQAILPLNLAGVRYTPSLTPVN